jgi:hypothetical protein
MAIVRQSLAAAIDDVCVALEAQATSRKADERNKRTSSVTSLALKIGRSRQF